MFDFSILYSVTNRDIPENEDAELRRTAGLNLVKRSF